MTARTIQVKDIAGIIESFAPLRYQESYDNSGLLAGDPYEEVTGVLISLDCTEDVVQEAAARNCNMIVCHHPIIFKGLKKLTGRTYVERTVIKAIRHGIAIYAAHTNLDNMEHGVSRRIADRIGLENARVLAPMQGHLKKLVTFVPQASFETVRNAVFDAGAGHIGQYDHCAFAAEGTGSFRAGEGANPYVGSRGELHREPETRLETVFPAHLQSAVITALIKSHPYEEPAWDVYSLDNSWPAVGAGIIGELPSSMPPGAFLSHLARTMQLSDIRYTTMDKPSVKRVAVCGGAGSFLLGQALAAGADAFVTADFKYHEFFDPENRLMIADIGHYESEIFTKDLLRALILEKIPTFAVLLSEINTNPVKYFNYGSSR